MLKIGEFSKLTRVSIRMLRHYDEIGLLRPLETDAYTGYRYYSEKQLPIAARIAAFKDMGFGLNDICTLLEGYEDKAVLEAHLLLKREELCCMLAQTENRIRLLETALERLRKDDNTMQYDVTIKTFPERYAATVRMNIPTYDAEGMLWDTLVRETEPLGIVPDDPCYCCVVYLDKEYREYDVEVEAQKTVRGRYPDTEHVRFKTLPPVTVASATCKGSYSQLDTAMNAVAAWVTDNGYAFDGPAFNIYYVSPHETDDPNEFVTEVCYPVKKKA